MLLFWDASALVKRFTEEDGDDTVDALFASASGSMVTTPWSYAETYSILLRRRNEGKINQTVFGAATQQLRAEVVDDPTFSILEIDSAIVYSSLAIMSKHNLNATDAALLTLLLNTLPSPPPSDFVLITTDKRLLRAASAERMKTLDPATLAVVDVPGYLATL